MTQEFSHRSYLINYWEGLTSLMSLHACVVCGGANQPLYGVFLLCLLELIRSQYHQGGICLDGKLMRHEIFCYQDLMSGMDVKIN